MSTLRRDIDREQRHGNRANLRQVFEKKDRRGDGTIDADAFEKIIAVRQVTSLRRRDFEALARHYDVDGTGAVDYSEFVKTVRQRRRKGAAPTAIIMMVAVISMLMTTTCMISMMAATMRPQNLATKRAWVDVLEDPEEAGGEEGMRGSSITRTMTGDLKPFQKDAHPRCRHNQARAMVSRAQKSCQD